MSKKRAGPEVLPEPASGVPASIPAPASRDAASSSYSISDLAKEFGITTPRNRFYQSSRLITQERIGTKQSYSQSDSALLIIILSGRKHGFTVEDVGE